MKLFKPCTVNLEYIPFGYRLFCAIISIAMRESLNQYGFSSFKGADPNKSNIVLQNSRKLGHVLVITFKGTSVPEDVSLRWLLSSRVV